MKRLSAVALLAIVGCGYSSTNNEVICQPKKIHNVTPIVCPNRVDVDVSLGVMVNGVGSMSTADLWLTVPSQADARTIQQAIDSGKLIKIRYDEYRVTLCQQEETVDSVTVLDTKP